jgi:DNA-binding MarR family transcriptional regulator
MSTTKKLDLVQQIILQLRLTSANSVMYSQATADKANLHSTDMECLDHLMMQGPLTAGMLSKLTGLTSGTMTALIDRLEEAGYVRRERGQEDRRQVLVIPNEAKINAELTPITAPLGAAIGELTAHFSEQELAVIAEFLAKANQIAAEEITRLRS